MKKLLFMLIALGLIGIASSLPAEVGPVERVEAQTVGVKVLDVAIDGRTFRGSDGLNPFDPGPSNIMRGNTFIVSGKVYPGGTIPEGQGVFGPDEPGSIGNWTCRCKRKNGK